MSKNNVKVQVKNKFLKIVSIILAVLRVCFIFFQVQWKAKESEKKRQEHYTDRGGGGAEKRDRGNKILWFRQKDLTNLLCISSASFNPSCFNLSGTSSSSQNKPRQPPASTTHLIILPCMQVCTWSIFKTLSRKQSLLYFMQSDACATVKHICMSGIITCKCGGQFCCI